jgi:hypothetical protein
MAPKKMSEAPTTVGANWIQATAKRLDHYARQVERLETAAAETVGEVSRGPAAPGLSRPPPPAAGSASAPAYAWPVQYVRPDLASRAKPPSYGIVPPRGLPTTPKEEFSVQRIRQKTALGFAPARRAVMICGRPVVAPSVSKEGCIDQ